MKINNFFQSNIFKIIIIAIGSLIVLLLVFKLGIFIGYQKAAFSYNWAENYPRNFGGPRPGLPGIPDEFRGKDFMNSHGTAGNIIKIDNNIITIKGNDNIEKNIVVSDKTAINAMNKNLNLSDLRVDDKVVIIGSPNEQGQIEARFIRIFP
jgi:hypothetical protein